MIDSELRRSVGRLFAELRGTRSDLAALAQEQQSRGRNVSVMGFGDAEATFLDQGDAREFPSTMAGEWNPSALLDPLAMIANLEYQRSQGVDCLITPAEPVFQTGDGGFHDHLMRYRHTEGGGAISYDLAEPRHVSPACLQAIAARLEIQLGAAPTIVDLAASSLRERDFRGELLSIDPRLVEHWVGGSHDLVIARAADAEIAHRLARIGVLVPPDDGIVYATTPLEAGGLSSMTELVSIIIPTFNGLSLLKSCLKSIADWVPRWLKCEILVADDGSTDGSSEWVAQWHDERDSRVTFLESDVNRGFLENCNHAASAAEGANLFFLNNDTVLLPDSVEALLRLPAVVSGSRLLFPDGSLQEVGGILFNDASAANIGKHDPRPSRPLYCARRPVTYCSGASLMVPRDVWNALGGFDDHFSPAYYEDSDLCLRARMMGVDVVYQPESNVVHFEGATSGTSTDFGPKRSQLLNEAKFRQRWAAEMHDNPVPPDDYDLATIQRLVAYVPPMGPK